MRRSLRSVRSTSGARTKRALTATVATLVAFAPAAGAVLGGQGTATLDGVLSPGEWDLADSVAFAANVPAGGTVPATLRIMNDATTLYLSVEIDSSSGIFDLNFELDASGDGQVFGAGDDGIGFASNSGPRDGYRTSSSFPLDTEGGGTLDVAGAFAIDGPTAIIEMSHPLDSGDTGHDVALAQGALVAFFMNLVILDPAFAETYYPLPGGSTDQIEILPEPGALAQAVAVLLGLLGLSRLRAARRPHEPAGRRRRTGRA